MHRRGSTFVVIPALNEAATIAEVVALVSSTGRAVVVDDGSSDGTGALAAAAGALVVTHQVNRGYDAALRSGLLAALGAGGSVAVTIDADLQHDPSVLGSIVGPVEAGDAALVVGSRPRTQRWSERLFASYTSRRYGIADPLSGLKAYDLTVWKQQERWARLPSVGTAAALAMVRSGAIVLTVAMPVHERVHGVSRFGVGWRPNARIFGALVLALIADGLALVRRLATSRRSIGQP